MIRFPALFALCLAAAGLVAGLPPAASAAGDRSGDHRDRTAGSGLSASLTAEVADQLQRDLDFCAGVDAEFGFDCTKYALRRAGNALDGNTAYRTARMALARGDTRLRLAVKDNVDDNRLPRLHGFQIYRPVQPQAVAPLQDLTAATLDDIRTAIATAPEQVGDHFAPLAAALASGG